MADTTNTPTATTPRSPNEIKTKIKLRVDTLANWEKCTVAPALGEPCLEKIVTETGTGSTKTTVVSYAVKYGDGTTLYKDLPYASKPGSGTLAGIISDFSDTADHLGSTLTVTDLDGNETTISIKDTYIDSVSFATAPTGKTTATMTTTYAKPSGGTAATKTYDIPNTSTSGWGVIKHSSEFTTDSNKVTSLATQSGLTAGTYSTNNTTSPAVGGTIVIPAITVNSKGIITKAANTTITLPDASKTVVADSTKAIFLTGTEASTENTENQKTQANFKITGVKLEGITGTTITAPTIDASTVLKTNKIDVHSSTTLTITASALTTSGTGTWTDSHATVTLNGTGTLTSKHGTVSLAGNTTIAKDLIVTGDNANNNGINGVQSPNFYGDLETKYLRDSDDGTVLVLNGGDASNV